MQCFQQRSNVEDVTIAKPTRQIMVSSGDNTMDWGHDVDSRQRLQRGKRRPKTPSPAPNQSIQPTKITQPHNDRTSRRRMTSCWPPRNQSHATNLAPNLAATTLFHRCCSSVSTPPPPHQQPAGMFDFAKTATSACLTLLSSPPLTIPYTHLIEHLTCTDRR